MSKRIIQHDSDDGINRRGFLEGRPQGAFQQHTTRRVHAHSPLERVSGMGWATEDSEQALVYLKRFGSITVLNSHIHQVIQKVEGNVTLHTAMSTAFPQPAPGSAPPAGPMKVPGDRLRSVLGITDVHYIAKKRSLAVVDSPLNDAMPAGSSPQQ